MWTEKKGRKHFASPNNKSNQMKNNNSINEIETSCDAHVQRYITNGSGCFPVRFNYMYIPGSVNKYGP